ncbi:MAG TPA: response regulator [Zoogloea sp.]|uniref:response regulator transcription factor n=2 Tax=Zoogloea sp. TaxID=49181 RepID=UPI002BEBF1AA|nr:response regulator [Zoogloea sp.]HMV64190.1 response regulator [Rhodocyclaceae bacterium]HNI48511.1 response regulator [Zoogloea sp.]HNI81865.1 response regulator [Rhodocyclaceae bacterium]
MNTPLAHIVDDDEAIRDALAWLFRTRAVECRAWESGEAFLDAWQPDWRGCIVLDIRMHGMNGLECFDALNARGNALPVIFLTGHGDVPMAVGALKAGAFDFLEKPFKDNDLVDVVLRAIDSDTRRHASQATQADIAGRMGLLTPREHEVMQRVLAGKFNKVIADELNISMRTVEVHRSRVFEKMGVRSAVELAQLLAPGREGRD